MRWLILYCNFGVTVWAPAWAEEAPLVKLQRLNDSRGWEAVG